MRKNLKKQTAVLIVSAVSAACDKPWQVMAHP